MRWLIFVILLSSPAMATVSGSNATARADGTVLNYNQQSNNALDGELPYATFSKDVVTCPTGKFTVAIIPSYTNTSYGNGSDVTLMAGLSVPTGFNGTVDRCAQQQRAMIRAAEIESDMTILSACKRAFEDGIYIDKKVFAWAAKCEGVQFRRKSEYYK